MDMPILHSIDHFFYYYFLFFIYDDIKHITKKKQKTLQRQTSSILARHDKHGITRVIA